MNAKTIQQLNDKNDAQELWDMEDWLSLISLHCDRQIRAAYMQPPTPSAPLTMRRLAYLLGGEEEPTDTPLWPYAVGVNMVIS
jgi:hypothetical protein